eukprot:TRINITY_DN3955_c0_g1_i1.p1 TRINITY_DN3955_c0_g1~~TRINITY_DN3955_c0_g1_i1.p1  ORF type:complete len:688 (+),score=132.04 TRINITY_DN3955_c0_g1_i1:38-2065(+)
MPALSKVQLLTGCSGAVILLAILRMQKKKGNEATLQKGPLTTSMDLKKERVGVDRVFFQRILKLLKIAFPSLFCRESLFAVLAAFSMLARTYCDLWLIKNHTHIETVIISRNYQQFFPAVLGFILAMIPISIINNLIKYSLDELALGIRSKLTTYFYGLYLKDFTYYKLNNLDTRIRNPDQILTQDLEKFSRSIVDLYSNIAKPIVDIVIFTRKLSGAIGVSGPAYMLAYLLVSGLILTELRRPMGRHTVHEQKLEGDYRHVLSRLITNSEEIAFYQGNQKEKSVIADTFHTLVRQVRTSMQFRFMMGILDHMGTKYFATVVGFMVISRPFFDLALPRFLNLTPADLMEEYYKSGRMLFSLSSAVGRLVLAGREMTRLAGFTARVTELMDVLRDLNQGRYIRTMVAKEPENESELSEESKEKLKEKREKALKQKETLASLKPESGEIIEVDHLIRFENVPLVTPNGDVLVRDMNFEVRSGMNVLIAGPNGCGKSSLFRILGGLWPLFGGRLHKPRMDKLFYIPQRPYMTIGSLRDQIIYPHSVEQAREKGVSDDDLAKLLDLVKLSYLVEREGGWDVKRDWMDVLSGGEKQRIAMSRLFYHQPQFAILDECTSAVSVDVEAFMYTHCRQVGITLFTVSHRKSLWKYHEYLLQFDGRGEYNFRLISDIHPDDQFGS